MLVVALQEFGKKMVPNNQNAIKTVASVPWKMALNPALYLAHDEPGVPGRGSRPEEAGDLFIVVCDEIYLPPPLPSRSPIKCLVLAS